MTDEIPHFILTTCKQALAFAPEAVVSIPAAVWLFGSALGLLSWMRRKAM